MDAAKYSQWASVIYAVQVRSADFVNMHRVNLDELGTLYKDFLGSDLTPVSMRRVILGEGARQEGAGLAAYRSRARQAGTDDGVFVLQPLENH
jgi:hypothetical protein